jgi:hypothetical protein
MKKLIPLPFLFCVILAHSQNVNIPDANFKSALLANIAINTNNDGEIQVSEAAAYTGSINVTSSGISDLAGIEAFTAITGLDCSYNELVSLNVSQNTSLTSLSCGNNHLTALSVSANTGLTTLDCSVNQLASLNVASNTSLSVLGCNNNQLTSLNLSANTALTILVCGSNQLTGLNLSANTALYSIDCGNNDISGLSVASNASLVTLSCYNNQIVQIDLSANAALRYLNCQQNQLTSLDVSGNTSVKEVRCSDNQLTSLNVQNGNNTNFTAFYANNNPALTCIQVDDADYMNANWSNGKDAWATYSTDCSVGIKESAEESGVNIYPNPSPDVFLVNLSNAQAATKIIVRDELGNCLFEQISRDKASVEIILSAQPKGVYFLEILSYNGRAVREIILQ